MAYNQQGTVTVPRYEARAFVDRYVRERMNEAYDGFTRDGHEAVGHEYFMLVHGIAQQIEAFDRYIQDMRDTEKLEAA